MTPQPRHFPTPSCPHLHGPPSVRTDMLRVVAALIPGLAALWWYFGWGVVVNGAIAVTAALAFEAAAMVLRGRPVRNAVGDGSAVVTALLLVAAVPPLLPGWAVVTGVFFAIVIAKQLYGGLGYNPFNPAMVAYVVLLVSFPKEMTAWLPPLSPDEWRLDLLETARAILFDTLPNGLAVDTITAASPLDAMKTQLALQVTVQEVLASPGHGLLGGRGWEWVDLGFLLGGLWLIFRRTITWHIPAAM